MRVFVYNTQGISFISFMKVFFCVLLSLYSMMPFFFWEKPILQLFFSMCIMLCCFVQYTCCINDLDKKRINGDFYVTVIFLLLFFIYWYFIKMFTEYVNIFGIFGGVILWLLPVFIFMQFSNLENEFFLQLFTNLMAGILLFSLIPYLFVVFGGNLPYTKISFPGNDHYDYFLNYRFFLVVHDTRSLNIFARFQSVFTEPGHLSMMTALLLYANDYKLKKWQNIVILTSLIFSFSLAGYVLLVTGLFIHKFAVSKKKILMFIILLFFAFVGIMSAILYYNVKPDSLISKAIIARLMPDKDRGFAGNNRNSARFKRSYSEFIQEGSFRTLTGWGNSTSKDFPEGGNSSYKNFIYDYGIIGFSFLWLLYLTLSFSSKSMLSLGFCLLFFLSFLQRPYATWISQIFIYIGYCRTHRNLNLKTSSK